MWKDIPEYEGLYQVSDEGQIQRLFKGRTKPVKPREGKYPTVSLSKDGVKKSFNIHRLVAENFIEKPLNATEVNHKDGNKWNNHVENLEWVTQSENLRHAIEELKHFPYGKPPKAVRCLDKDTGELVAEYDSLASAARSTGSMGSRSSISLVCQGYQKSAYGYKWEYAD